MDSSIDIMIDWQIVRSVDCKDSSIDKLSIDRMVHFNCAFIVDYRNLWLAIRLVAYL